MTTTPSARAREAAADLFEAEVIRTTELLSKIRLGHFDDLDSVQIFARFEAEIRDECSDKMREAVAYGYDQPEGTSQCEHGKFRWDDCIACYDDALYAATATIREPKP